MSQPRRIYLDHAATTPILPAAKAAMAEAMERWANPSSPHAEGRAARAALEVARERVKKALGWEGELIFTSGASEAIEIALRRIKRRVIASPVEHDAVFRVAPHAETLPLVGDANISREALSASLLNAPPPIVVIQHVNSETGVEQRVSELTAVVREAGGILLSDCSQSAGKIRIPDADMVAVSAHKFGGPPGIGALLVRDLTMLQAVGGQEFGYRAGTQNVPGAVGFAAAIEAVSWHVDHEAMPEYLVADWLRPLTRPMFEIGHDIERAGGSFEPGGARQEDSHLSSGWIHAISMPHLEARTQLIQFDLRGLAVSAGSACSSGSLNPSRTLLAFGVPEEVARRTIRVSIGWSTTIEDLHAFRDAWLEIAEQAKKRAA